jgi:hypothetical protein
MVKREKRNLYKNGMENKKNMMHSAISKKDLEESLRITINDTDLA